MVPVKNITAEQSTGLFRRFLYKTDAICVHKTLNSGSTIPVSMETTVFKLYVSAMYDGIQVETPSRNIPCKIIQIITAIITGEKRAFVAANVDVFLTFAFSGISLMSIQYLFHMIIIIIPHKAENKNTDLQPKSVIRSGAIKYMIMVPYELAQDIFTAIFL